MEFRVKVTRRVIDGDEFGPCEYVVETEHPNGESMITQQHTDAGKAFKDLLLAYTVEKVNQ